MGPPSLLGFLDFLRTQVEIPISALPDNSPQIEPSYDQSIDEVNDDLALVSVNIYTTAIYNLATHYLVNVARDVDGSTYFAEAQDKFGLTRFVVGPLSSAADVSTSDSFAIPDYVKRMSISDVELMKTPWGRAYMSIAMKAGTLWGIS